MAEELDNLFRRAEDGALVATVQGYQVEVWRAKEGEGDPDFPYAYRVTNLRDQNAAGDVAASEEEAIRAALNIVEQGLV